MTKNKRLKTASYDDEESEKAREAVDKAILKLPAEADLKLTFMDGDLFGGGGGSDNPPNHGCKVSRQVANDYRAYSTDSQDKV